MKKRIIIFSSVVLLLSASLTACGIGYSRTAVYDYGNQSHEEKEVVESAVSVSENKGEIKSAIELLTEAVDRSMVPEDQLDSFSVLSNAILDHTYITLTAENEDSCTVDIRYPLVSEALAEKAALLPAEPTENDINNLLAELTAAVEAESLPMAEGTYDLPILLDDRGNSYIEWTEEALAAMTGGLQSMLE